ncbi:MAG TPA: glycosyltransferase family 39 protein, partial [Thermoplasmata archaeon]|nr:glycosyltransferase family 39 protein [Thermoplasmata archaeon]
MNPPSRPSDYPLAESQRALERLRILRKAGVPFDPADLVGKLHDAIEDGSAPQMSRLAQELDAKIASVELIWNEIERQRVVIERLRVGVVGVSGEQSRLAELAAHFLESLQDPFTEASTLAAQVRLGREVEARLRDQLRLASQSSRPRGTSLPPAATRPVRRRRPRTVPHPAVAWITSPAGLTFLAIAAFVLIGAYERLTHLGALSLWNDEAQSTLISFSILQHGYPVITAQHIINNYEPAYPYLEAASVGLLGHSNFAYRLPSALVGIALIPIAYYVGARLRERYVGITVAAMVALSSEYIAWSRQARWYMLLVVVFAIGTLLAIAWARTPDRTQRRWYALGLLPIAIVAGFTSIGLFLLYVPAILVGGIVYLIAVRWTTVLRIFGYGVGPGQRLPKPRFLGYPERRLLAVILPVFVAVVVLVESSKISDVALHLAARAVGFTPYPLVWSSNFGAYLAQYYLGVLLFDVVGVLYVAFRRDALELAVLAFTGSAFVSVSSLASLTNDIAAGSTSFERHIVPLLFFMFLIAALGAVSLARFAVRELDRMWRARPHLGSARTIVYGVAVAVILVVPGIVVPSGATVHQHPYEIQTGQLVTWVPFSIDPQQPSAIYQAQQADYQLAAEFVLAHRSPYDVVAGTNPGAPAVYIGSVQYWIRGNALNTTVINVGGKPAFFQTGSLLIANTTALENVLFNTSGWLISDVPGTRGLPFPNGMATVITGLMRFIP